MATVGPAQAALRRQRLIALVGLLALAALAWVYLWREAARMEADMAPMSASVAATMAPGGSMAPATPAAPMADATGSGAAMAGADGTGQAMPGMAAASGAAPAPAAVGAAGGMGTLATVAAPAAAIWSGQALLLAFLMWAVMMVAMMLPSAAPAILLYGAAAAADRVRAAAPGAAPRALAGIASFAGGYIAVWTAFSLAAAALQLGLQQAALVTPMLRAASPWLAGIILVAAGIYQWLPLKAACLRFCRDPVHHFLMHWRPGAAGALRMGAGHGLHCVGCCWALMLLLFVAGVMNLLWVAVIAGFVLVEKLAPAGGLAGRLAGLALVGWGVLMIAGG